MSGSNNGYELARALSLVRRQDALGLGLARRGLRRRALDAETAPVGTAPAEPRRLLRLRVRHGWAGSGGDLLPGLLLCRRAACRVSSRVRSGLTGGLRLLAHGVSRQPSPGPTLCQGSLAPDRTRNSATFAVTTANVLMPTTMVTAPIKRPAAVTG